MIENLNEILSETILSSIPQKTKPLKYIMNILNIGRESTYRRLRGDIPFTFEEVVTLAVNLNFSIDEFIEKNEKDSPDLTEPEQKIMPTSDQFFYATHLNYYNFLESLNRAKTSEIFISLNRLYSFLVVKFDVLFKFYYYLSLHRFGEGLFNSKFSEIELPEHIALLQQKIKDITPSIKYITFIFDRYIILKLIQDIQYYHIRKLITNEELQTLKKEINNFINYIEDCIQIGGINNADSTNYFYLSLLNIDKNSLYGTIDGNVISKFFTYSNASYPTTRNEQIASHHNWIHSLKRSSILISQSNEIAQATFLSQQRKNIEMITNDLFLYYG